MFSSTTRNALLRLYYNATAIPNLADNAATGPITNIAVALHTADPGAAGTQSTNEVAYTGYARVNVARTVGGWTVTANSVSPVATIAFGQRTDAGAPVIATHFSTGFPGGGATTIINRGIIGSFAGAFTALATDTFTAPGAGFATNDRAAFYAGTGNTLPAGITEGVVYWVVGASGDTFQVSLTQGGAAIDITAAGDGLAYRVSPITINLNSIPQLTAATAVVVD